MVVSKDSCSSEMRGPFEKAVSLLSSSGLDGAMMLVDRELERDPDSWEAWAAKADVLYLKGMYGSALKASEKAIDLNSRNALAWSTRGNALYRLERYAEAIEAYDRAIEMEPMLVRAWYNKKLAVEMQLRKVAPRVSAAPRSGADEGDGSLRACNGRVR